MSVAAKILALAGLGGLGYLAFGGGGSSSSSRRPGADRATNANGSTVPTVPSWVPEGATLVRSPSQQNIGRPIVRSGGWYWSDLRSFPGSGPGAESWVLLTTISKPPKEAKSLVVRVWIRGESRGTVGGQYDIRGDLLVPLIVSNVQVTSLPLLPGTEPHRFAFELTRRADGNIDVKAANTGWNTATENYVAVNDAAMALEFQFFG